jgi:hypothetical protein
MISPVPYVTSLKTCKICHATMPSAEDVSRNLLLLRVHFVDNLYRLVLPFLDSKYIVSNSRSCRIQFIKFAHAPSRLAVLLPFLFFVSVPP